MTEPVARRSDADAPAAESETGALEAATGVGARSSALIAVALLVGNGTTYGFQVLMGRVLSVEEYGLLAGFSAAIAIITVSTSALQATAARAIAVGEHRVSTHVELDGLTRSAILVSLVAGAVVAAASPLVSRFLNVGAVPVVFIAAFIAPAAVDSIAAGRLQGLKRFDGLALYSVGQAITKLGVGALVLAAGFRVTGVVGGIAISTAVVAALGLRATRSAGRVDTHVFGPDARRGFAAFTLFWAIISADVAFARAFFPAYEAGVYAAAAVLGKAVLWLPTTVAQLVFPTLANRSASGQAATPVVGRAIAVTIGISLLAVGGLALLGRPVFEMLYGDRYVASAHLAWQIGLAMVPLALCNLLVFHYLARAQSRFLVVMGGVFVVEVVALYLLPRFGGSGYAITLGVAGTVMLVLMLPTTVWGRVFGRLSRQRR